MLDKACIFCRMIEGEIQTEKVYEDSHVFAFRDINPMAPTHILIVPRTHLASMNELSPSFGEYMSKIALAAKKIAEIEKVDQDGYRLVINTGEHGGQSVFHLHVHLLAGRQLAWPPG